MKLRLLGCTERCTAFGRGAEVSSRARFAWPAVGSCACGAAAGLQHRLKVGGHALLPRLCHISGKAPGPCRHWASRTPASPSWCRPSADQGLAGPSKFWAPQRTACSLTPKKSSKANSSHLSVASCSCSSRGRFLEPVFRQVCLMELNSSAGRWKKVCSCWDSEGAIASG